jgi:hypothetical protein
MFPKDAQAAVTALPPGPEHAEQDEHNTDGNPDAPNKGRHENRLPPPDRDGARSRRVGLSGRLFDETRTGPGTRQGGVDASPVERKLVQMKFQGHMEARRSLRPHDVAMTWIIVSIPAMLLAIAIAVLPVLLMSVSEARRGFELVGDVAPARPAASTINAFEDGDALRAEKAA